MTGQKDTTNIQDNQTAAIPDEVMMQMKFYTAWLIFTQDTVSGETFMLHCTHKYLGGQNQNSMGAVFRITKKFMDRLGEQGGWPRANFTQREFWPKTITQADLANTSMTTPPPGVSVLTTPDSVDGFWPFLRAELDQFRADDYAQYRPHITVPNYPSVTGHFQAYAIMNGHNIVVHWRNPHWEKIEKANQRRAGLHVAREDGAQVVKPHPLMGCPTKT